MKQILHIFWKDTRRFWPEIGISVAITAVFTRVYPVNWILQSESHLGGLFAYAGQMQILANVMTVLVPVSWWLLVTRVIHAEALVGQRQFWITRPYEWPKLLAAKALFLAAFLYLPFLASQCALLWEGGFQPQLFVPGLLFELLLISGILVVPLVTLATVTSTLVRMALTILGIFAAIAGVAFAAYKLEPNSVSTPYGDRYSIPAILIVGGSAIVVQYARRKVWFARMILLSLPLLGVFAAFLWPDNSMVETAYPLGSGMAALADVPIQFAFHNDPIRKVEVSEDSRSDTVEVSVPLEAAGVLAGRVVTIDDAMARATDAHGITRSMPWTSVYNHYFLRGGWVSSVSLAMKRSDYQALKGRPLTLQLSLALTEAKTESITRIPLPKHDFAIPDFGICAGSEGMSGLGSSLDCRTALHGPPLTYVKANLSGTPCSKRRGTEAAQPAPDLNPDVAPDAGGIAHATSWEGSLEHDPSDVGLTSVWTTRVSLSEGDYLSNKYLCPGTIVSFTRFSLVRRLRTTLTIPNFVLPEKNSHFDEE